MTVAGLMIIRADFQSVQTRRTDIQNIRSASVSFLAASARSDAARRADASRRTFLELQFGRGFKERGQKAQQPDQLLPSQPQAQITVDQPQRLQTYPNILEGQSRNRVLRPEQERTLEITPNPDSVNVSGEKAQRKPWQ
jgi:hypothetical protein